MTKRDAKRKAWEVAGNLIRQFWNNDGWCPFVPSGCWADLSEEDYVRAANAFKEVETFLFDKAGAK